MIAKKLALLLAVSATALANVAEAVPIEFVISHASGNASGVALGATVTIAPSAGLPGSFVLDSDLGVTSKTFDFLDISVSGLGIVAGTIEASLGFSSPTGAAAEGLFGGFAVLFGLGAGGVLSVLDNPQPIAFGNGGLFGVTFEGFTDHCLFCSGLSGTVKATVSLLDKPSTTVPEPATLTLLGAGLIGLAVSRRLRRKARGTRTPPQARTPL